MVQWELSCGEEQKSVATPLVSGAILIVYIRANLGGFFNMDCAIEDSFLIAGMAEEEVLIELFFYSDSETEFLGFTDEDLRSDTSLGARGSAREEISTDDSDSDSDSDTEIESGRIHSRCAYEWLPD